MTVTAKDAYGNTAAGYGGWIHLTASDPAATLPADYCFAAADAGVHKLSYTLVPALVLRTPGSQTVRGRDAVTATITGVLSGILIG